MTTPHEAPTPRALPDWIARDAGRVRRLRAGLLLVTAAAVVALATVLAPPGPDEAADGIVLGLGGSFGLAAAAFAVDLRRHGRALRAVRRATDVEVLALPLLPERAAWPGQLALRWALRVPASRTVRTLLDVSQSVQASYALDTPDGTTRWFREAGFRPGPFRRRMRLAGDAVSAVVADDVLVWRSERLHLPAVARSCPEPPVVVRHNRPYTFHVVAGVAGALLLVTLAAMVSGTTGDGLSAWDVAAGLLALLGVPAYLLMLGLVRLRRRAARRAADEGPDEVTASDRALLGEVAGPAGGGWPFSAHVLVASAAVVLAGAAAGGPGWAGGGVVAAAWLLALGLRRRSQRTAPRSESQ